MKFFQKFLRSESGIAAVEFVLIMPLLIFLFLGVADFVGYASAKQKATDTADAVGDLVAQFDRTIRKSNLDDIFIASKIMVNPAENKRITDLRVEVSGYGRNAFGTVTRNWSVNNNLGSACDAAPSSQSIQRLMGDNNDVIVTLTCTQYNPIFLTFLGTKGPFSGMTVMKSTNLSRPRVSTTLAYDPNG